MKMDLELQNKVLVEPGHQCRTRYKPFCGLTGTVVEVVKRTVPHDEKLGYWVRINITVPELYKHFERQYNASQKVASQEVRNYICLLIRLGQIRMNKDSIDIFVPYDSGSNYTIVRTTGDV